MVSRRGHRPFGANKGDRYVLAAHTRMMRERMTLCTERGLRAAYVLSGTLANPPGPRPLANIG